MILRICCLGLLVILSLTGYTGEEWPTLHGNLQRHGFYESFPAKNLSLVWRKELYREMTGTRAEVIVGDGLAFMGTYQGNLYAWDAQTGDEKWVFRTGRAIGHSPMYADQTVYVGSMDGNLYAVNTQTGKKQWHYATGEGIWSSPVVHMGLVFCGSRDGTFYAVNQADGSLRWKFETEAPILNTASISPDGKRILFASEDMHLYCLERATGDLVWKSNKLPGLSFRDYFPVIIHDTVFITTNPVKDFHTLLGESDNMLLDGLQYAGDDSRYIFASPEKIETEQQKIIQHLKSHPEEQPLFAFNLQDGSEPWVAPILYTGGLHNPLTPPCYNPVRDETYIYVRSAYGVWDGGGEVRSYTGVGTLDIKTGDVGLIVHSHESKDPNRPPGRKDLPWMSFNTIGDETQTLASSPDYLFSIHQGYIGSMNFKTGRCKNLYGKRDTYGGFYGPGNFGWKDQGGREKAKEAGQPYAIINEWHGPARAIVSVCGPYVYYHVGSQVLCLKGEFN
jgi:outer membrane protein assembly factor BamB